ncbi:hypothetical protein PM082_024018 [Marasmius tenuissimus]|nr:hypothetical protein PM082_024018 [Marasmius tenuissimus]
MERVSSNEHCDPRDSMQGSNTTATTGSTGGIPEPTGASTNVNENPFGHTVNGNTRTFSPSTYIENNQCQHVHQPHSISYHGCTIHYASPAPASTPLSAQQAGITRGVQTAPNSSSFSTSGPESHLWVPFHWALGPWALLTSFVQAILATTVISGTRISSLVHGTSGSAIEYDVEAQIGRVPLDAVDTELSPSSTDEM